MTAAVPLLLAAMLSIQFGAARATLLIGAVGFAGATALRLGVAALLLTLLLRPWRGGRIARADLAPLLGYGVALGVMNLLFYAAIARIPLAAAVALEFTGPLLLGMAGTRRATDAAWLVLLLAGLAALLRLQGVHAVNPTGTALALAAGACWAAYMVLGRRVALRLGVRATALGALVAAVVAVPFGIAQAGATLLAPPILRQGLVVGLFASAIPYTLEMLALPRIPTRPFAILMALEPAVAALIALAVLDQRLAPGQWAGLAAVVAAAAGTARGAPALA